MAFSIPDDYFPYLHFEVLRIFNFIANTQHAFKKIDPTIFDPPYCFGAF